MIGELKTLSLLFYHVCFGILQNISKPSVPEVSLIFDEKKLDAERPKSYQEWRDKQRLQGTSDSVATCAKSKSVKFDGIDYSGNDQPRQNIPTHTPAPFIDANSCRMKTFVPTNNVNVNGFAVNPTVTARRVEQTIEVPSVARLEAAVTPNRTSNDGVVSIPKPTITMEDMYKMMSLQNQRMEAEVMRNASIPPAAQPPNPCPPPKEITLNDVFQLLLQSQQTQRQSEPPPQLVSPVTVPTQTTIQPATIATETSRELSRPDDGEPSLKDLFHIIVKQQEQLLNIQKQVQAILVQSSGHTPYSDNHRPIRDAYSHFSGAPNPMGVMTSLEINVQKYTHNKKSATDRKLAPPTSGRGQTLQCCTNCRSPLIPSGPEQMIVLDETARELQNTPDPDQDATNDWALYGNILNQVNHVLQNSPPVNAESNRGHNGHMSHHQFAQPRMESSTPSSASSSPNCNVFDQTPSHIRTAQIQQIGLKFDDVNVSATTKR